MTYASSSILQRLDMTGIMQRGAAPALLASLCLIAQSAMAEDKPAPQSDDLDVTMQIITDPDAKRPDEVVRHIPLPARKPSAAPKNNATKAADKNQERVREAKDSGREAAERAKERAKDAAEQREQATRSMADERRRNPPKPPPPARPSR